MIILDKLIILSILRHCFSFKPVSSNLELNRRFENKNKTFSNTNFFGYDHRYNLEEKIDYYNIKLLSEKKKLLEKLESDISTLEKINLIEKAKLDDLLKSDTLSSNIFKGKLMNDFNFEIN